MGREEVEGKIVAFRPNTRSNVKVAKLLIFNENTTKVLGFIMVCRLYIRMKMIDIFVKEQVQ